MTTFPRLISKTAPASITDRVSAYRDRLTTSSYHRVDLVMPDEKRDRIKKIAKEAGGSYAETVSALAQLGLDHLEMLVASEKGATKQPDMTRISGSMLSGSMGKESTFGAHRGLFAATAQIASASFSSPAHANAISDAMRPSLMNAAAAPQSVSKVSASPLFTSTSPAASDTTAVGTLTAFFRKQKAKDD